MKTDKKNTVKVPTYKVESMVNKYAEMAVRGIAGLVHLDMLMGVAQTDELGPLAFAKELALITSAVSNGLHFDASQEIRKFAHKVIEENKELEDIGRAFGFTEPTTEKKEG